MGLCSHDIGTTGPDTRSTMSQPSTPSARLETAARAATSRVVRLLWVSVVLLLPVVWGYVAVLRWPFDGTVVYASSSSKDSKRWSDEAGVVVRDTYGNPRVGEGVARRREKNTRLRVVAVDGTKLADWVDREDWAREQRRAGDELQYTVRIGDTPEADPISVKLRRVPVLEVASENIGAVVLWCLLAVAGPFVFWRRPRDAAARAMLALTAFVPIGMTAFPFGLQVIDFAGGRGMWPYVVGEAANCLAWGTTLFFALMFPTPLPFLIKRPWLKVTPFLLPFVVYAVRLLTLEAGRPPGLARVESLILLSALSGVIVMPVCAVVLAVRMRQETNRENRIAILLILTTVLAALVMFVALGQLPELLGAGPSLGLALQPFGFVIPILGLVVAVLRYRLYELDVIVRRSLLVLVAICVAGLTFLGIAFLLDRFAPATDRTDLLLGGLIAVLLIPLGRYVRRWLNRLVFGARDDPYQVVSELRGLGASVSIEDSLAEALRTLSRTLRLGFAAIEVEDEAGGDPLVVAVGEPDLRPTVIELSITDDPGGGCRSAPRGGREPFGPRDRRLLDDVASQLGALVASLVTNQALRRSRERLISARRRNVGGSGATSTTGWGPLSPDSRCSFSTPGSS